MEDMERVGRGRAPRVSSLARAAFGVQIALLRRNMLGSFGDQVMVITTTGRKSGKRFSTPIAYLQDGQTILALNHQGRSNWYKNLQHHPHATLEIKGKRYEARAEFIHDAAERRRFYQLYRRERAAGFSRLFGIQADAPADELARALDSRVFVRFHLQHGDPTA